MPSFYFCAHEDGFVNIHQIILKIARWNAFAVAYFDFVLGFVKAVASIPTYIYPDTGYLFLNGNETVGPVQKYIFLGMDAGAVGMLLFSIFLLFGIYFQRCGIIKLWCTINAVFLLVHGLIVIGTSFVSEWNGVSTLFGLLAFRVFGVAAVGSYYIALKFQVLDVSRVRLVMTQESESGSVLNSIGNKEVRHMRSVGSCETILTINNSDDEDSV